MILLKQETTTFTWDSSKITNVPVQISENGEQHFDTAVVIKVSSIAEYMGANNITEYDYNDFVSNKS